MPPPCWLTGWLVLWPKASWPSRRNTGTRWLNYVSIFGHLQQWKIAQKCKKFAKVGLLFCQKRNKPPTSSQRLVKLCHSGEISPNLVTLRPNKNNNICANKLFCKYRLGFGNALSLLLLRHFFHLNKISLKWKSKLNLQSYLTIYDRNLNL